MKPRSAAWCPTQVCVFSFVEAMCDFHSETPSESDEEELHRNIHNVFLVFVNSSQIGAALEACLTEEELGRVGLCCHFALGYLCESLF